MQFVCGLVKSFATTPAFRDFRYLKINCNLNVKSKFNCRRLSRKLPKNAMVEKPNGRKI